MHKTAIQFGSLTISWYGILVASGFGMGVWTASRRARREGLSEEHVIALCNWLILGAIVGSRLWYVMSNWSEYFTHNNYQEIFIIWHGGLVFYGGLVGAVLTGWLHVRYHKLPFWKLADLLAPSLALGHFFGRLGCLMNGCCYGKPTDCVWAIHFPAEHETGGAGVHPTQIYEALANLGFSFVLAWLFRHKKYDGQVFSIYLIGYAILRFCVEHYRGDYSTYYLGGQLTPAQVFSIPMLVLGLVFWWRLPQWTRVTAKVTTPKKGSI